MPLLKGGPRPWKWTEIILKSDKLIVNVVVFKLCNCIWVFLKSKGEKNRRHYLLTDPRILYLHSYVSVHLSLSLDIYFIALFLISYYEYNRGLIYYFTYFSTVVPSNIYVFLSCRLFFVIRHFQQFLCVLKFLLSSGLGSWSLNHWFL